MIMLATEGLSVGYARRPLLVDVDVSLASGSITCLLGPNGIGKTSLFKTLLGLLPPLGGRVLVRGTDLSHLARRAVARDVAYVPQTLPATFSLCVRDLVVMGRTAHLGAFGVPGARDYAAAKAALAKLGISSLADQDCAKISGGQRQLALVARALAQQAQLVVMDEPTASLDIANRAIVLDAARDLARAGIAVVFSTHEPEQAFAIAQDVWIIERNRRLAHGATRDILTSARLSALYGMDLQLERTPSGRHVVTPSVSL